MSFSNYTRSDRPESPTDLVFIYLGFVLGGLWVYANITQKEIVSLVVVVGFASSLKIIKVGSDFQKKRKAANDVGEAGQEVKPNP